MQGKGGSWWSLFGYRVATRKGDGSAVVSGGNVLHLSAFSHPRRLQGGAAERQPPAAAGGGPGLRELHEQRPEGQCLRV